MRSATGDAVLSNDGHYRYALKRSLHPTFDDEHAQHICLFLMLNPSTADDRQDDPTIRRCIGFAQRWGYGMLTVGNLYALRATDPAGLAECPDPVGPKNDDWLRQLGDNADLIVAAWGASGPKSLGERAATALVALDGAAPIVCLGQTQTGHPRHPLYVRGDVEPIEMSVKVRGAVTL